MRFPRSRPLIVVTLIVVVLLPLGAVGVMSLASARGYQLFGGLTNRVRTTEKVVALTFDDGPHPAGTRALLDSLKRKDVRATFYVTGRELSEHPDLGKAIADAGHELGNHSYHHERMVFVTPAFVADEVERTDDRIRATGYQGEITFRPPNGKKLVALPHYLSEHHRKTIMWDVEPDSGEQASKRSADEIVRATLDQTRPGSIILLHGMYPGRDRTRAAVEPIVDGLRERGYRFVTVSELLTLGPDD
ncbi:polysaccharide deacetylase family protein [Saccharothrix variisporea]|uniref:Peptidoglycan/xylan/chitin deacetylase (PgdA/CDA1 family) n=1 Tax=Saccharothrix variisporea TaxID=543527 RepID=A0A495WZJ6_9PSEU|nr:polysaccharide deacetylase family protein [Saccharothrix variisporea]RKT67040.1 peptidoglycan/xylan/chitin deacetylase (PgdA/CDA1 family) [Saccharothrix variisporea]